MATKIFATAVFSIKGFLRLTVTSERSVLTQVVLPYKNDRSARRRTSNTPLKGTKIVLNGRGPDSFLCHNNSKNISYLRKYGQIRSCHFSER